nr:toll/interleukin-1 receptor domain-containing protein [uncultured Aminipila sp.]
MNITDVFISHSREDKAFVDVITDFLLRCGIPTSSIFCSSLSGNGIKHEISNEVKRAISDSKLNIALLSDTYYKSDYCQNEAGVLWYLETPVVVIALPEITHTNIKGFLNSENLIRRLDNSEDILTITDIIKDNCTAFNCNVAKMTDNIDKLIREYQSALYNRVQPGESACNPAPEDSSNLEKRILSNDFSDGELLYFKYFYDTQTREVLDDMLELNEWYLRQPFCVVMNDQPLEMLKEDGILEEIFKEDTKNWVGYRLPLSYYRQLKKISTQCLNYINEHLNQHTVEPKGMPKNWNMMDWYIQKILSEDEKLLLQYVIARGHNSLGTGWRTDVEIKDIKKWEEDMMVDNHLSENYAEIVSELFNRKWLEVCEFTQYGNPKEYKFTTAAEDRLFGICKDTKEVLRKTLRKHSVAPF